MGTALRIIGGLWVGVGIVNLIAMFSGAAAEALWIHGLMANSVAFILPGLAVLAIGVLLYNKQKSETSK